MAVRCSAPAATTLSRSSAARSAVWSYACAAVSEVRRGREPGFVAAFRRAGQHRHLPAAHAIVFTHLNRCLARVKEAVKKLSLFDAYGGGDGASCAVETATQVIDTESFFEMCESDRRRMAAALAPAHEEKAEHRCRDRRGAECPGTDASGVRCRSLR